MITRRGLLASSVPATLLVVASSAPAQGQAERTPVVATFSILGNLVANVGGERIALTTLVGPNGDGHVYTPSPADARKVQEAKAVFTNGLKFEGWVGRLVRASGTKAKVVEAAKGVRTIMVDEASPAQDHGDHSHAGEADPHAWQSVTNAKVWA